MGPRIRVQIPVHTGIYCSKVLCTEVAVFTLSVAPSSGLLLMENRGLALPFIIVRPHPVSAASLWTADHGWEHAAPARRSVYSYAPSFHVIYVASCFHLRRVLLGQTLNQASRRVLRMRKAGEQYALALDVATYIRLCGLNTRYERQATDSIRAQSYPF
jgi:hypothetical protein